MRLYSNMALIMLMVMLMAFNLKAEDSLASQLVNKSIRKKGVCVVVSNSTSLGLNIAENSDFIVLARFTNDVAFKTAQKTAFDKGVLNKKIFISSGEANLIPIADKDSTR